MVVGDQSFGWIGEVPVEVRRLAASASVGLGSSGMGLTLAPSPTALTMFTCQLSDIAKQNGLVQHG